MRSIPHSQWVQHPLRAKAGAALPMAHYSFASPHGDSVHFQGPLTPVIKGLLQAHQDLQNPGPSNVSSSPFADYMTAIFAAFFGPNPRNLLELYTTFRKEIGDVAELLLFFNRYGESISRSMAQIYTLQSQNTRVRLIEEIKEDPKVLIPYRLRQQDTLMQALTDEQLKTFGDSAIRILESTNEIFFIPILLTQELYKLVSQAGSQFIQERGTLNQIISSAMVSPEIQKIFNLDFTDKDGRGPNLLALSKLSTKDLLPKFYLNLSENSNEIYDTILARTFVGFIESSFIGLSKIFQTLSSDEGFRTRLAEATTPRFANEFMDAITELRSNGTEPRTIGEIQSMVNSEFGTMNVLNQNTRPRIQLNSRLGTGTVASAYSATVQDPELLQFIKGQSVLSNYHRLEVLPQVMKALFPIHSSEYKQLSAMGIPPYTLIHAVGEQLIYQFNGQIPADAAHWQNGALSPSFRNHFIRDLKHRNRQNELFAKLEDPNLTDIIISVVSKLNYQLEERLNRVVVKVIKDGVSYERMLDESKAMQALTKVGIYFEAPDTNRQRVDFFGTLIESAYTGWRDETDFAFEAIGAAKLRRLNQRMFKVPLLFISEREQYRPGTRVRGSLPTLPVENPKKVNPRENSNVKMVVWEYAPGVSLDKLIEFLKDYKTMVKSPEDRRGLAAFRNKYREMITDHPWLLSPEDWIHKLPHTFLKAQFEQLYMQSVVHGDPHPGNIFIMYDGKDVIPIYIDTGLTLTLSPEKIVNNLVRTANIIFAHEKFYAEEIIKTSRRAEEMAKPENEEVFKDLVRNMSEEFKEKFYTTPYSKRNTNAIGKAAADIFSKYDVQPPAEDVLLIKSQLDTINIYDRLCELTGEEQDPRIILEYTAKGIWKAMRSDTRRAAPRLTRLALDIRHHPDQTVRNAIQYMLNRRQLEALLKRLGKLKDVEQTVEHATQQMQNSAGEEAALEKPS